MSSSSIKKKSKNKSKNKSKISLPYSGVDIEDRTKGMIASLADMYPQIDPTQAKYRIFYDTVIDRNQDVEYDFAFEIIAIPVKRDLLFDAPDGYSTKFYGAINYSVSPKGNKFAGSYRWRKNPKDTWRSDETAWDIEGILREYNFSFNRNSNYQKTKLPCAIYANLISGKLHYIGQSKTEVDTGPFAETIIKAVAAIQHRIIVQVTVATIHFIIEEKEDHQRNLKLKR
jgi:hypothetical protein